jgi:sulfur carrier protein
VAATEIEIEVNGAACRIPSGTTLTELLNFLQVDPTRVAIELDRNIVKTLHWPDITLSAGSKVEIVQFVGGG